MELLTDRLLLRDATEDDVPALLTVALSNPEFLEIHEGPDAPTAYDESAVGRDLAVASMDPARHPLAVCSREDGAVFGWAEVLDEHPCDGVPWIGLLELRADAHGSGLGREAAEALAGWASERGAPALRAGVDDGNEPALRFWSACGFVAVQRRERSSPAGPLSVTVLERRL